MGRGAAPLLARREGRSQNTVIGGAAIWAMAGHSKDAEKGAAAFLNYLLKPEVQARFHQLTGYVPVTLEGYELTKQQGFYDKNPGTDIAVKALSDKKPTINSLGLRLGNFVQIRNIIDEELEAVWAGKKTAKQALRRPLWNAATPNWRISPRPTRSKR